VCANFTSGSEQPLLAYSNVTWDVAPIAEDAEIPATLETEMVLSPETSDYIAYMAPYSDRQSSAQLLLREPKI